MAKIKPDGYREKITDEEFINMIEQGVLQSIGDWLNSSDLTRERLRSTYEYAGLPIAHLAPQGVSSIVASDTTEVIEAYCAVISELMFENMKLAKFLPYSTSPSALMHADLAADAVNYCLFKKNDGWALLNTWVKASLMWKNAIIRWDYIEDFDYKIEEYEEISQVALDELLAMEDTEIIGSLHVENDIPQLDEAAVEGEQPQANLVYKDVKIRRKIDKSRIQIENVPPENFRITRDATTISDADYIGIVHEMTRSDIRKHWPEVAEDIEDWSELGDLEWNTKYTEEMAARKLVTGQEYWQGSNTQDIYPFEANRALVVTESWLRADRDGDGIAELKHTFSSGNHILFEEDVDFINLASICPFEIPHEFYGLSMADMVRPSTLASTAIIRGLIENTYLTNFSPKLADPNVVDFSALQNMKPKQLIATNGNPTAAVAPLPPETLSPSTVPALEFLQTHKEQATGMSKAAQGLNDTLYISGNSEQKLAQVQGASQKRIQHIVRRFAETGFKRLIEGIYRTMKDHMTQHPANLSKFKGAYAMVDVTSLPDEMDIIIDVNVGENSNESKLQKLNQIAQNLIPALQQSDQATAIKKETPVLLAQETLVAMGLDPSKYLKDWESEEYQEELTAAAEQQAEEQQRQLENQIRKEETEAQLAEANVRFTQVQSDNALQDNIKQLAVALDKSHQEWAKLAIDAAKEGLALPPRPDFNELFQEAMQDIVGTVSPPPTESLSAAGAEGAGEELTGQEPEEGGL